MILPTTSIMGQRQQNLLPMTMNQKRSYSRGGCKECKRRKIRCPENKPSCSTCLRLGKECSYPLPGEKVLRVSKKMLSDIQSSRKPNALELTGGNVKVKKATPKPLTIQMYLVEDFGSKQRKRRLKLDDDYLTNDFNPENEIKETNKDITVSQDRDKIEVKNEKVKYPYQPQQAQFLT